MHLVVLSVLLSITSRIPLNATPRLPSADGSLKLVQRKGSEHIVVHVSGMKPASLFGGDFNTYVLWLVSPEGKPINAGEIVLVGDEGRLETTTTFQQFEAFVTAEPYYAVDFPSRFVVLNTARTGEMPHFDCKAKGIIYNYERDSLADAKRASGPVHTDLAQAYTAVRLAEQAGAASTAPDELRAAEESLRRTSDLFRERKPFEVIRAAAHQTIELAIAAKRAARNHTAATAR